MDLNYFLSRALVALLLGNSQTICAILIESIVRNISVKLCISIY